jgi:hypothetical protein
MGRIAKILPGEAGEVKAPPNRFSVNIPLAPPAITASNKVGFINM